MGQQNHCNLIKSYIHPRKPKGCKDPKTLGSDSPPLQSLLTSLETWLESLTSRKPPNPTRIPHSTDHSLNTSKHYTITNVHTDIHHKQNNVVTLKLQPDTYETVSLSFNCFAFCWPNCVHTVLGSSCFCKSSQLSDENQNNMQHSVMTTDSLPNRVTNHTNP